MERLLLPAIYRMVQDTQEATGTHRSIRELGEVSIRISICLYGRVLQVFLRKHAINKECGIYYQYQSTFIKRYAYSISFKVLNIKSLNFLVLLKNNNRSG